MTEVAVTRTRHRTTTTSTDQLTIQLETTASAQLRALLLSLIVRRRWMLNDEGWIWEWMTVLLIAQLPLLLAVQLRCWWLLMGREVMRPMWMIMMTMRWLLWATTEMKRIQNWGRI